MNNFDLVQVFTSDEIKLSGLYSQGDKTKSACILVHGFTADFYSHEFYQSIVRKLKSQGNAIILAQTRGTGIETEFLKKSGEGVYIGSYFEKLSDAHLDISAFVAFMSEQGYQKIVLIGHSLGTIKCVRYLFEGEHKDKIEKLILLAPFDKNAFLEIKAPGKWFKYVEIAKQKIDSGFGKEIVPIPEYEDFAISYDNYYSWYEQSEINRIWDFYKKDYDFPVLQKITIPVKAILGGKDEFVTYPSLGVSAQFALEVIQKHIKNSETALIRNSNHTYFGFEKEVADEVGSFLE
jgi:pimeloyl-ACP methyl ester carboxylesterase